MTPKIIKAEILNVLPLKPGSGGPYRRICWKPIDYPVRWMKTDICPNHENWDRWQTLLEIGNIIGNLKVKDEITINGDSYPELISKPEKQGELNI